MNRIVQFRKYTQPLIILKYTTVINRLFSNGFDNFDDTDSDTYHNSSQWNNFVQGRKLGEGQKKDFAVNQFGKGYDDQSSDDDQGYDENLAQFIDPVRQAAIIRRYESKFGEINENDGEENCFYEDLGTDLPDDFLVNWDKFYMEHIVYEHLFARPPQQKNYKILHSVNPDLTLGFFPNNLTPLDPKISEDGVSFATGGRKASKARVWVRPGKGLFIVNKKPLPIVFPSMHRMVHVLLPLQAAELFGTVDVFCSVKGGGPIGQTGAIQYALSRALFMRDPVSMRPLLCKFGLLTRDTRVVEEKKGGLRKARRPSQWVKR